MKTNLPDVKHERTQDSPTARTPNRRDESVDPAPVGEYAKGTLLPCPFCGGKPQQKYDSTAPHIFCKGSGGEHYVSVCRWTVEEAASEWNRRAAAPKQEAPEPKATTPRVVASGHSFTAQTCPKCGESHAPLPDLRGLLAETVDWLNHNKAGWSAREDLLSRIRAALAPTTGEGER
jgi:hypothetical protein